MRPIFLLAAALGLAAATPVRAQMMYGCGTTSVAFISESLGGAAGFGYRAIVLVSFSGQLFFRFSHPGTVAGAGMTRVFTVRRGVSQHLALGTGPAPLAADALRAATTLYCAADAPR